MRKMLILAGALMISPAATGELMTLLPDEAVRALAGEISGESAKRNLEELSRHHRMRGSEGYHAASEFLVEKLRGYGLVDAEILAFPADGKIFYGTQRSRPGWDAEFAELWEVRGGGERVRLANWESMPLTLAQDSESAEVTAELVDVGAGTKDADYEGKDVKGRIVLTSQQPGAVVPLAIEIHGAAGIVSYAQNQRTGWWGDRGDLIRWGHLDTFAKVKTFAFMVTLDQARAFQARLAAGEKVTLHAIVRAGQHEAAYEVPTATIPGSDPRLKSEEIVFSCHLDHPRPGANDNASGCSAILEIARALSKLVAEEKIARPARTIRFVWPAEIEGTHAFLNGRPDIAKRIKAAIHLDMVGGGPETKAINFVTRGPASLPSFVNDVAENFVGLVNAQSEAYVMTQEAELAFLSPEGGKEPFRAEMAAFTQGSDHEVYTDGSWGIPAIYMNQWPDRYIHTNFDVPANIDPTVVRRFAFIGAASAVFLAGAGPEDAAGVAEAVRRGTLRRTAAMLGHVSGLPEAERSNLARFHFAHETALVDSMERFFEVPATVRQEHATFVDGIAAATGLSGAEVAAGDAGPVYRRNPKVMGPLVTFGYDYLADKLGGERVAKLGLLSFSGPRGSGADYAYEALNLVDGRRTVRQIRDDVSAIYGPVAVELVAEYLAGLAEAGVVER